MLGKSAIKILNGDAHNVPPVYMYIYYIQCFPRIFFFCSSSAEVCVCDVHYVDVRVHTELMCVCVFVCVSERF